MKGNYIFILLGIFLFSCSEQVKDENTNLQDHTVQSLNVPPNTIDKSKLQYDTKTSLWTLDHKRFSGYAVSYYEDSTLMQKFGILAGKKQNEAMDWFPDGHLKYAASYFNGKLNGEKKSWAADSTHHLIAHLNYRNGKADGVQKKWYPTGEIFKILHLEMGKEEGIQQAFRKNGNLFANYEARAGRIFGLKRAALCFGLEDENIQNAK